MEIPPLQGECHKTKQLLHSLSILPFPEVIKCHQHRLKLGLYKLAINPPSFAKAQQAADAIT